MTNVDSMNSTPFGLGFNAYSVSAWHTLNGHPPSMPLPQFPFHNAHLIALVLYWSRPFKNTVLYPVRVLVFRCCDVMLGAMKKKKEDTLYCHASDSSNHEISFILKRSSPSLFGDERDRVFSVYETTRSLLVLHKWRFDTVRKPPCVLNTLCLASIKDAFFSLTRF